MRLGNIASQATKVDKPWGYEIIFALTGKYCGKILHLNARESTSLQYHTVKQETLYLLSGKVVVVIHNRTELLKQGYSIDILPEVRHRLIAIKDSDILEASTPELNDVVRVKDNYGRV